MTPIIELNITWSEYECICFLMPEVDSSCVWPPRDGEERGEPEQARRAALCCTTHHTQTVPERLFAGRRALFLSDASGLHLVDACCVAGNKRTRTRLLLCVTPACASVHPAPATICLDSSAVDTIVVAAGARGRVRGALELFLLAGSGGHALLRCTSPGEVTRVRSLQPMTVLKHAVSVLVQISLAGLQNWMTTCELKVINSDACYASNLFERREARLQRSAAQA